MASSTSPSGKFHGQDPTKVASPLHCKAQGDGLHMATVRRAATFTIIACDEQGEKIGHGGDTFFVAIRGASRVRARVTDNEDGTYTVEYKPSVSGLYSISVSVFGLPLSGSPFAVSAITPAPDAENCELRGEALRKAVSRHPHQFEVRFRDSLGHAAVAEDLDVFVVPIADATATASINDGIEESGSFESGSFKSGSFKGSPLAAEEQPGVFAGLETRTALSPTGSTEDSGQNLGTEAATETGVIGTSTITPVAVPSLLSTYQTKAKVKIEVGPKPLIVRAGADLESEHIGQLNPGQMVTVVQAEEKADGSIRALVEMVDETEATQKVLQSWWQPRDETTIRSEMEGLWMNNPELYTEMLSSRLDSARSSSSRIVSGRREKQQGSEREQMGTSNVQHGIFPGLYEPFTVPSQSDFEKLSIAGSPTGRSFSPGRGSDSTTSPSRQKRGLVGWVTLAKGGDQLVRKRERLDAGERRRHMQQWVRRQRIDKSVAQKDAAAKAEKHKRGHDRHGEAGNARKMSPYQQELTCDPTGIGFAFGGVEPGILHAHGQLHEVHKVFYSVGRVGKYQLHVALRKQALPLPGSPFDLEVLPGPAHAHATQLVLPTPAILRGEVGTGSDDGCKLTVHTRDKMENVCRQGGASVTGSAQRTDLVECQVSDNGDGSYGLHWKSRSSGSFEIHVLIDGVHVSGSPFHMTLSSRHPDMSKTQVTVPDSNGMIAGEETAISLTFLDQFDNVCTPGSDYEFGMALLPEKSGEKLATCPAFDHKGMWAKEEPGEEYKLIFTPIRAGMTDVHVWCVSGPPEKRERTPLPGTPSQVLVQSGQPDAAVSAVDGYGIDHCAATNARKTPQKILDPKGEERDRIFAGDTVFVKPVLADLWGNPANVPDGALTIGLEQPDGTEVQLDYLTHVKGGLSSYEIRHETQLSGKHSMHIRLNGQSIKGSPVEYDIAPASHEAQLTIIESDDLPAVLFADADPKYSFIVRMRDRFGNRVDTGGASIAARLQYIKQGMHDSNALNAHNHVVSQEDMGDGSYLVTFGLLSRGLNFSSPLTVQVIVNLDRDPKEKPNGVDLPAVVTTWGLTPEAAAAAEVAKNDKKAEASRKAPGLPAKDARRTSNESLPSKDPKASSNETASEETEENLDIRLQ